MVKVIKGLLSQAKYSGEDPQLVLYSTMAYHVTPIYSHPLTSSTSASCNTSMVHHLCPIDLHVLYVQDHLNKCADKAQNTHMA